MLFKASSCPLAGWDSLFPAECFPLHPAAMGSTARFRYRLWDTDS